MTRSVPVFSRNFTTEMNCKQGDFVADYSWYTVTVSLEDESNVFLTVKRSIKVTHVFPSFTRPSYTPSTKCDGRERRVKTTKKDTKNTKLRISNYCFGNHRVRQQQRGKRAMEGLVIKFKRKM